MTAGYRQDVEEICAILSYYAAVVVISYRRFGILDA